MDTVIRDTHSNTVLIYSNRLYIPDNSYEISAWVPFVDPIYKSKIERQTCNVNSSLNQNYSMTQIGNTTEEETKVNSVIFCGYNNNCFSSTSNDTSYEERYCSSEELIHCTDTQLQHPVESSEDAEMMIQPKMTEATTCLNRKIDSNTENNQVKNVPNGALKIERNIGRKAGGKRQKATSKILRRSKRIADKKDKKETITRSWNLKRDQPLKQQRNLQSRQEVSLTSGYKKKSQRNVMNCQNRGCRIYESCQNQRCRIYESCQNQGNRIYKNPKRVRSCKAANSYHWNKVLLQSKINILIPPGVLSSYDVERIEKSSDVRNGLFSLYPVYPHDYHLRPLESRFLRYPLLLEKN